MTEAEKARLAELKAKTELTETEKAEMKGLGDKSEPVEGKTFTQEDVNALISRESKKAIEKVLKDLGVENVDNAKEGLAKLKEFQDGQKTDNEKLQAKITEYETNSGTNKTELETANNKLAMLEAGIPIDKITRYSKLVNSSEGETLADRITATLEEFPINTAEAVKPDIGGQTGGGAGTDAMAEGLALARAAAAQV